MHCTIQLQLFAPADDMHPDEVYIELEREFEIPSIPSEGVKLWFNVIGSTHPNARQFAALLEESPATATGIFKIDTVYYHVDSGKITCQCYDGWEPNEIEFVARQLVLGYGFTLK